MKKQDGYILDTAYPVFFYKEMQPLWLNSIVSFLGFQVPDIATPFSYLELGCATGINLLVCAINNPHGDFVGIDFNKEHIHKAKELAQIIGVDNVHFICCDFSIFLESNTQYFDFIVSHGTFSWISEAHQKNILDIVSKFLNDLGIFYLHYMCYPASSSLLPIQKLLHIVDTYMQESSLDSIDVGKKLFFDLNDAGAFVNNSNVNHIINLFKNSHSYLAHEFLTDYWKPLYSVDVHQMVFNITGSAYLGSANVVENIDSISIPTKLQHIVSNIKVPALKEYVKDLARDSKQRVDIFQRNPKKLNNKDHIQIINKIKFKLLAQAPKSGSVTFQTQIGNIKAPKEIISPMFRCLEKNEMRFDELLSLPNFKDNPIFLIETLFLAMNSDYVHPVSNNINEKIKKLTENFNKQMKIMDIELRI